ncbi:hypothetical protein PDG61_20180 [Mycolicibacterium sp. BiH015]|uniref:hypothetical protein n=1 Tax=Mycolicibacterium sp. BiH015 TaxID=3018808 RepID=UPI0022E19471|nr:hypothetical protein [Mycolicibacterium sp. BiH015]MDA2893249.1 hypothetical protein [Mycolicibacterium sp. BiH015]
MNAHNDTRESGDTRSRDGADADDAEDDGASAANHFTEDDGEHSGHGSQRRTDRARRAAGSPHRQALALGLTALIALGVVAGWLGWGHLQAQKDNELHAQFMQAARQGAVNLTSIDWQRADADIERILSSATGTFAEDFAMRSQPLIEMVRRVQSKSEGSVTAAGAEAMSTNDARVLVAVRVNVSNAGAAQQEPRLWRMRITVERVGDDPKIANVEFVP